MVITKLGNCKNYCRTITDLLAFKEGSLFPIFFVILAADDTLLARFDLKGEPGEFLQLVIWARKEKRGVLPRCNAVKLQRNGCQFLKGESNNEISLTQRRQPHQEDDIVGVLSRSWAHHHPYPIRNCSHFGPMLRQAHRLTGD